MPFLTPSALLSQTQSTIDKPAPATSPISSLGLTPDQATELRNAVESRNYVTAEKLLLSEIALDPHSSRAAKLLAYVGSVYFLDADYFHAAVAWKKSDAIVPLSPELQFSLAMAYIRIAHSDWARPVLESLSQRNPQESLYPYWLGRLDYDGHNYPGAIREFQRAIALAPEMARAYDNLGLCYYYQNQNELAIENYQRAITLDQKSPYPSPWPYLNLSITLQFMNRYDEAEKSLREAIQINPRFAQAHMQLGLILEQQGKLQAAIQELDRAASFDVSYAEPHMAMARIYRKLGQPTAAREQVQIYLKIHAPSTPK